VHVIIRINVDLTIALKVIANPNNVVDTKINGAKEVLVVNGGVRNKVGVM